ncbi:tetratricopeptide repeat protein, partial [Lentzea sp.]|uniref:tetratricopeptide repeat protein n=1 Tax=Lentzea sp. TaxID=56099 RepID=UPI002ED6BD38
VRELVRANLVVEHVPGRFTCHDLLRVYAADRAAAEETAEDRASALERMFDHHLHTLIAIHMTHHAGHRPLPEEPAMVRGTTPELFETLDDVHDWFLAEKNVLRAVIAHSEAHRFDRHTWQLVWIAFDLIDKFGPWRDWVWVLDTARLAATRDGEHLHAAKMTFLEAIVSSRLGRFEESRAKFEAGGRAYAEIGDVPGQVRCQSGAAWALLQLDRPQESLETAEAALELQRNDASATNERISMALHQVVEARRLIGDNEMALELCAELESLETDEVSPYDEGQRNLTKGAVLVRLGRFDQALETLGIALERLERAGSWDDVAAVQNWAGDAHQGLDDISSARSAWSEALATFEHHQHPNAAGVRVKLAALPEN